MESGAQYRSVWTFLYRTVFTHGFVDAAGVNTRYIQAGDPKSPAVIFLHGTAGSWETFCKNIESHSKYFNCYAIDMIGSGFTDKPEIDYEIPVYVEHVRSFMQKMGLTKASFVGVSLGSWIAAKFASLYPEMTDKVTMIAAAGVFSDKANMATIRTQRTTAVTSPSWDSLMTMFSSFIHDPKTTLINDIPAIRLEMYRLPNADKAMKHVLCLQEDAIRDRNQLTETEWRSIKAPFLFIGAIDHPDVYLKAAKYLSGIMSNARYVEMKGVNHWAQFEDADAFNTLNIEFMKHQL